MDADRHGLSGDGGHLAEMMRAEAELLSSHDTHQVIADRLGISLNMVQIWCRHLVQRSRLGHCTHVLQADGEERAAAAMGSVRPAGPASGPGTASICRRSSSRYANAAVLQRRPAFMPDLRYGPPPRPAAVSGPVAARGMAAISRRRVSRRLRHAAAAPEGALAAEHPGRGRRHVRRRARDRHRHVGRHRQRRPGCIPGQLLRPRAPQL